MYLYLELVDVVSNALYELLARQGKREILYSELDVYGAKVVEKLNEDENVCAIYVVSKESQHDIFIRYGDFFESFVNKDGAHGIRLRDGIDAKTVWTYFCAALSVRVIRAFRAQESLRALGV